MSDAQWLHCAQQIWEEFEPKAWATHRASCLCYSSTECLAPSRCCRGERTLLSFPAASAHVGTAQEYGLCTPVRGCLAPSPRLPSSFIMCLLLAFLSCFPSPSPSSVHTACFRTPSLCPPLLLMFDKRKCAMPDKHIPVPNSLGLF